MKSALVQGLACACVVLLVAVIGLSLRLWWVKDDLADVQLQRDQAQRNHNECVIAGVAWERTVDTVQGALYACTRERDEVGQRGAAAVAAAKADNTRLGRELAAWRERSAAAEALPACRAVLDLELCPELGDY